MVQHVVGPTHRHGGTLDLIVTFRDCNITNVHVDPADVVSDHSLVTCRLRAHHFAAPPTSRSVRCWRRVDLVALRAAILDSPLACPPPSASASELFDIYETTLCGIADQFAPAHSVRSRCRPLSPWFDAECRAIRRECRRLERKYRRTKTLEDRAAWTKAVRKKHADFLVKKNEYWTSRITRDRGSPVKLWRSMKQIMRLDKNVGSSTSPIAHTADQFLEFFENKVQSIRSTTDGHPSATVATKLVPQLIELSALPSDKIRTVIMASPAKSCELDPVPTFIVKQLIDDLLPFLTAMCNASLNEGNLPISQRHAIVRPLLKKQSLSPDELKNYRPVSNLTFISKVVERIIMNQIVDHLHLHGLMPRLQSAYRRHHSTETALLRVMSDIIGSSDNQRVTLLGLLDLSAAFDCVDHDILLSRLEKTFGIGGSALKWIASFLSGRTQQVCYNGRMSRIGNLLFGVPQGSVLGSLFYILYTAELLDVVAELGFTAHSYADDTQIYIGTPAADVANTVQRFTHCVDRVNTWMARNRLKLNADKSQVVWIGTSGQLAKIDITQLQLGSIIVPFSTTVADLGVTIDSQLSMTAHISSLCRSCFYQLRQLRAIRHSLTTDAARTLVQAFISSRLDYCNSLLYGIADCQLRRLQCIQNAAARLITRTRKFDHVSPVLRDLHWLPVRQRIVFKVATLVFKCLHGLAPSYLTEYCTPVSTIEGRRHLRSATTQLLFVPSYRTTFGSRSFAVSGPTVWNNLPATLRTYDYSVAAFRKKLKTHLFNT